MNEKTQILFMQTRLLRLASDKWNMSLTSVLDLFKKYKILEYIDDAFGIFHCEGDEAVLEDIEQLMDRKEHNVNV